MTQDQALQLMAEQDDPAIISWNYMGDYARMLEAAGRYEEAISRLQTYMSTQPEPNLWMAVAASYIARQYLAMDRPEEALAAVEVWAESGQAGAVRATAECYAALGRVDFALELLTATLQRYPTADHVLEGALRVAWGYGRYDEAARLLLSVNQRLQPWDWEDLVGDVFVETFADNTDDEALEAFASLAAVGLNGVVQKQLAWAVHSAGRTRLAMELMGRMQAADPTTRVILLVEEYALRKEVEGVDQAGRWLRRETEATDDVYVAMAAFEFGADEALWSAVDDPRGQTRNGDYIWLLRAAAVVRYDGTHPHADEVREHLTQEPFSYYHVFAQYVMGIVPLDEAWRWVGSPTAGLELAYFVGVRHQAEGDLHRAFEWYRAASQMNFPNMAEWQWAERQLQTWRQSGTGLEEFRTD